ncbi:MAG TPA: hypothetical protein VK152_01155 [Paludibacter sp.]|nr:hypothetical protein [Paludibacter sp.]
MPLKRNLLKVHVKSVRTIAPRVYVLSFPRIVDFTAGQVIAIDLVDDGEPRLYSIASGEKDENIEILFDEKPEGKLSPRMSALLPGDDLYVSEPFGTFSSGMEPGYWIAAGTGVAPFVSMARSGLAANKILVQGGRYDSNFYFSDELEKIFGENYVRCCSQQPDTRFFHGRLTVWLTNQTNLPADYQYYLCGSPEMVVQVRDILIAKGIPFQNIISETYF